MPRKLVEYPANEELVRVFCCFSPFLCLFVLLEGMQVPANEELARVFCCFSPFFCLFVLLEGMQVPANEELAGVFCQFSLFSCLFVLLGSVQVPANEDIAHVSSRAYAHLTNKQTNENTPNGVIEKIERKDEDDGKNFGRYFRSRFWLTQKYCFRSSVLERVSFLFEFSSLLILFLTLRKKIATFTCLHLFVSILLRNFAK